MFQNVHRLFGVSNITKTLNSLKSNEEQDEAMKSIIYEADMRERFPVHGCCAVIQLLRLQFQHAVKELQYVRAHLAACREQQQLNSNNNNNTNNNNNEINYENGMNYGVNPFLSNENVSVFVDNLLSENMNLASIQAQMEALGMKEQEETTNLFPSDLERMQFSTRNIDDRQPYIDQTRETFESSCQQMNLPRAEIDSRMKQTQVGLLRK
ncbi:hypothetical protein CDL12_28239 [Handroanthus impetiginosus]|uniref:LOB domain-containing protein n=1 Tax=Handroanthus impetiginosus TaxID=429701 RepID=A0A2G9G245_9LAMI|nr:hypothetical protein CDL12_28239 [Handroanthus impetiginosus]